MRWHMLPKDAGQIVERTYAIDEHYLYRRVFDTSDLEESFSRATYEDEEDLELINGLPKHGPWEDCDDPDRGEGVK